ncbi:MAG: alanyl-tRNA editing protein [Bryobacterales bacterium]|nr:alanyl-tRNA editing protein [Bryobacterales bacterium]
MHTERLYYEDCYLREFTATVLSVGRDGAVELDRSAFYPESGGQAHDLGAIEGAAVGRVTEHDDRVLHFLAAPPGNGVPAKTVSPGETVHGAIDWERRFDLMQHHTGQHLLSAIAEDLYGWKTESVHMSAESATIELGAEEIGEASIERLEREVNRRIQENLPVRIATHASAEGIRLRKATERFGPLRVVSIADLDHSACGGAHVRATGEIGSLAIGRAERIRKNTRLEFACGMRAARLARRQSGWLREAAAVFQSSPDRIAELAAAQRDELAALSKRLRTLETQESKRAGGDARRALGATGNALCCAARRVPDAIGDAERAFAQGFCERAGAEPNRAILLTVALATGAFLLRASPEAGFDAKAWLLEAGPHLGAKGGGTPEMISGRMAKPEGLAPLIATLPFPLVELPSVATI